MVDIVVVEVEVDVVEVVVEMVVVVVVVVDVAEVAERNVVEGGGTVVGGSNVTGRLVAAGASEERAVVVSGHIEMSRTSSPLEHVYNICSPVSSTQPEMNKDIRTNAASRAFPFILNHQIRGT